MYLSPLNFQRYPPPPLTVRQPTHTLITKWQKSVYEVLIKPVSFAYIELHSN